MYYDIKKQSGVKQLIVLAVYKLNYLIFLFAEELCQFLECIVKKRRIILNLHFKFIVLTSILKCVDINFYDVCFLFLKLICTI